MEIIGEVIGTIIFEYLLQIPGAGLRWLCQLGKKPFKVIWKDEPIFNMILGIIVMMTLLFIYIMP